MKNTTPTPVIIDKGISSAMVDFISGQKGLYRAIVKTPSGILTVVDDLGIQNKWARPQWNSAIDVFRGFKKGALQTIQFKAEGSDYWLTVFARVGNKVKMIDRELLISLEVGDINQNWSNSNLYSQAQYSAVKATNWGSMAYVFNETVTEDLMIG